MTSLSGAHCLFVFCRPRVYVIDRSRVTPRYFGAKSCTSTYPVVSFRFSAFWQPVCCPGERKPPLSSLRLGAASSSHNTRSGFRNQDTVYSQDVKMSLIVWQGSSHQHIQTSANRLEGGHWCSGVYVEERLRKYTPHYGSLGKTVLADTLSADSVAEEYGPKTRMFRCLIGLAMSLIVVRHLIGFDNFIMCPACQTVSYMQLSGRSAQRRS